MTFAVHLNYAAMISCYLWHIFQEQWVVASVASAKMLCSTVTITVSGCQEKKSLVQ